MVYLITIHALWRKKTKGRADWILALYITTIFLTGLVYLSFDIQTQQLEFVDYRNFPGGPEVYQNSHYNTITWVIPNAAFIVTEWLADGFLVSVTCVLVYLFPNTNNGAALPLSDGLPSQILHHHNTHSHLPQLYRYVALTHFFHSSKTFA